jgi:hypothetical protein
MSRRPAAPMLPGWNPLGPAYPRRRGAGLARWWWPALVTVAFLALVGYVLDHDQVAVGVSVRGLVAVALAAVVVAVLTVRRGAGARALLRTLAEYAAVAVLAVSLVTLGAHHPAPAPEPKAKPDQRAGLAVVVEAPGNVRDWLADRWREAGQRVDQQRQQQPAPPPRGGAR